MQDGQTFCRAFDEQYNSVCVVSITSLYTCMPASRDLKQRGIIIMNYAFMVEKDFKIQSGRFLDKSSPYWHTKMYLGFDQIILPYSDSKTKKSAENNAVLMFIVLEYECSTAQ